MTETEVQTRNDAGELRFFKTISEAFEHSVNDSGVWKISFSYAGEQVRLIRTIKNMWCYEPIDLDWSEKK